LLDLLRAARLDATTLIRVPFIVQGGLMLAVRSRVLQLGLMLATMLSFTLLPTAGQAYSPEEQAACTDDAFRVCGAEIPDVNRVTACMVRNRSLLSPGCKIYFRDPDPPPSMVARKPISLKSSRVKSSAAKSSAGKSSAAAKAASAKSKSGKKPE
jgi:hypothetical protein